MARNSQTGDPLNIEEQFRPYLWTFVTAFGFEFRLRNNKPGNLCAGFFNGRQISGHRTEQAWVGFFIGVIVRAAVFGDKPNDILSFDAASDADGVGWSDAAAATDTVSGDNSG